MSDLRLGDATMNHRTAELLNDFTEQLAKMGV
jgi:hypothetical protein